LVPNFDSYKNLESAGVLETIRERYREDMERTKLSFGELMAIKDEMARRRPEKEEGFKENDPILYLLGNLNEETRTKMGINDSKIMVNGYRIYHSLTDKDPKQEIKPEHLKDLYDTIQNPDEIYERINVTYGQRKYGREFHFSKKVKDWPGKILNVVLRKSDQSALQIITMGFMGDDHWQETRYKKIR
jgi:hypothetical protein